MEWLAYSHAVSQTTIPIYVIAGNHDTDSGKNYQYYTKYTKNTADNYIIPMLDFDLVGINYVSKSLSEKEILRLRGAITNASHNFTIIATHFYMDEDGSISALGKDIDRQLIVKPTIIMGDHVHAEFIRVNTVAGYPVIEDLTDFQDGLPGNPVNKNYSAGILYTVTASRGDVEKVSSRVIHIFPEKSINEERVLYDITSHAVETTGSSPQSDNRVNQTRIVNVTEIGRPTPVCTDTFRVCSVRSKIITLSQVDSFWDILLEKLSRMGIPWFD